MSVHRSGPAFALMILVASLAGCSAARPGTAPPSRPFEGPVRHVFLIVLENKGYETTFGARPAGPFLGTILPAMGRLLTQYYGTSHASLGNYISLVSGQAANVETQADCPYFTEFQPGTMAQGQAVGQGCVYPTSVLNLGDQLATAGFSWRMYGEDMDLAEPSSCRHPALGAQDPWQGATAQDQYATRHVPFVYFHTIIDDAASCRAHVVDLKALTVDLAEAASTPNLAFITPDLCSDGHDVGCADGRPGGYASMDAFLEYWVPRILAAPAFKHDGLLVVTFDESDSPSADSSACCNEPTGPNTPRPGLQGPGGGRTGAVLLSPCVDRGTRDDVPYNHYGLLRSIEDIFGLDHLGYAGMDGLARVPVGRCFAP